MVAILTGVTGSHKVVLICSSLIIKDVKLLKVFHSHFSFIFRNSQFRSIYYFLIRLFIFLILRVFWVFMYFRYFRSVVCRVDKNLFPICWLLLFWVIVFFTILKIFCFMRSHLLIAVLSACVLFRVAFPVPVTSRLSHFLFFEIWCVWSYAEVLDPFEVEF